MQRASEAGMDRAVNGARTHRWVREHDLALSERLRVATLAAGVGRRLATIVAHSADGWWCLTVAAALVLLGGPRWRASALAIVVGFVTSATVVRVLKTRVRRERPAGEWGTRQRRSDPHAFPSGHAARAAMLAVIVGIAAGSAGIAAALALWAVAVATARVAVGVHYLSDVVAGLAVGIACGAVTMLVLGAFG